MADFVEGEKALTASARLHFLECPAEGALAPQLQLAIAD